MEVGFGAGVGHAHAGEAETGAEEGCVGVFVNGCGAEGEAC